ncbi:MAG: proton-conducting transporter membrane subunit, partial [Clostridia bacterium]
IGKKMPALMTCFTIASLGLVGIPPLNAFVSKWFLIEGSFNADIPVISWLGPIVLITSALLTAGYLLKISYKAFWGDANIQSEVKSLSTEKSDYLMIVSVIILAVLTLLMGLYSSEIFTFIESIINIVF